MGSERAARTAGRRVVTAEYDPIAAALEAACDRIMYSERLAEYVQPGFMRLYLAEFIARSQKKVERLAGKDDVDGLIQLFYSVARRFAEQQRADACGYMFEDIAWYDTGIVRSLLPLAFNWEWDGLPTQSDIPGRGGGIPSEDGDLMAKVMDVRQALGKWLYELDETYFDPGDELGANRLVSLVERLGGRFPEVRI